MQAVPRGQKCPRPPPTCPAVVLDSQGAARFAGLGTAKDAVQASQLHAVSHAPPEVRLLQGVALLHPLPAP